MQLKIFVLFLFFHSSALLHASPDEQQKVDINVGSEAEIKNPCSICYEELPENESGKFHDTHLLHQCKTCKNVFHQTCIDGWYTSSGKLSCPLCRADNAEIILDFTYAIDTNNVNKLHMLLAQHRTLANYLFNTETKTSALHRAAERGFPDIIRWLIYFAANPNVRNSYDETPLHLAASAGNCDAVEELCKFTSLIFLLDQEGHAPLHRAASGGWTRTVNILLRELRKHFAHRKGFSQKLDHATFFKNLTPLHYAVMSDNTNTVKAILKYHPNQNLPDWQGKTPLQHAVLQGNKRLVNILVKNRTAGVN